MKNKVMVILLTTILMFTGVAAEVSAGTSPYCTGYADDVCTDLNWFQSGNTYYCCGESISIVPLSGSRFRLVHNGFSAEFSKYDYLRINDDGSIEYCIGKSLYTYHPCGDYMTYHYRWTTMDFYR